MTSDSWESWDPDPQVIQCTVQSTLRIRALDSGSQTEVPCKSPRDVVQVQILMPALEPAFLRRNQVLLLLPMGYTGKARPRQENPVPDLFDFT